MALDLSALDGDLAPASVVAGSGVALHAPLDAFEEDPDNPRFEHDPGAFESLVDDVREHGILQPIVVRRMADSRLRIRFGARRYRAAKCLGLGAAPYVVTEDERQFDDYAQVSENERRSPLQPLELATFIAKKLAQGEKKKDVAARLRMDPSALTHLLALIGDVPAFVLELYHSRKCRSPQYLYELRRLWDVQAELVQRRCAEAADIDRKLIIAIASECTLAKSTGLKPVARSSPQKSVAEPVAHSLPAAENMSRCLPVGQAEPMSTSCCAAPDPVPAWSQLMKPRLLGVFGGRDISIDLTLCPSSPNTVVVRYDDGNAHEVPISAIQLTLLCDAVK